MKKFTIHEIAFLLSVLIVFALSLILFRAPDPLPTDLSSDQFSANRAYLHIKMIAQRPHSIGTTEHEVVKNYIKDELQKLNIPIREQLTTSVNSKRGLIAGYVHNIIGTIEGTSSKKCVLIVGHYDSQPHTPGAADDGSAIASMLEAARALKQKGTFKNDIVFLFTDGEESGLLGARAFVDENTLRDSVGIILNIEARGSSGPSITYEVSPDNGWIIREYAKAVPYPIAHAIAYEVYKLLPNDSDFTPFREYGLTGFNIGFIDDFANYHSMTDTPENLSLASLQHHGSYIMGIANHFGNIDLLNTKAKDVVYFNWVGYSLIIYPIGLNIPLVILICVLLVSNLIFGLRTRRIQISRVLASLGIQFITIAITVLFAWLLKKGILAIYSHYTVFYSANFYNIHHYFVVFTLLSIVVFSIIYAILFKQLKVENLLFGSILFNIILMFVEIRFIPSGAYLSIMPLLFMLIGLLFINLFKLRPEDKSWKYYLINFLMLLPIISLLVPLIKMFFVTFGLQTIIGGVAVTTVLLGYLVIPFSIVFERKRWFLPILATTLLVLLLFLAHFSSEYHRKQPLQSFVSYAADADSKESVWFTNNKYMDNWKKQFFTNPEEKPLELIFPKSSYSFIQNKAEYFEIPYPEFTIITDSLINGSRKVTIQITTKRNAQNCRLSIDSNANLSSMIINDKIIKGEQLSIDTVSSSYNLIYFGLNDKPLKISLICNTYSKIRITLIESKIGLPENKKYEPMPDYIIPDKGFISNVTLIKKYWEL